MIPISPRGLLPFYTANSQVKGAPVPRHWGPWMEANPLPHLHLTPLTPPTPPTPLHLQIISHLWRTMFFRESCSGICRTSTSLSKKAPTVMPASGPPCTTPTSPRWSDDSLIWSPRAKSRTWRKRALPRLVRNRQRNCPQRFFFSYIYR